jgi:thiamine biosynthesis lipoprotein
MKSYPAAVWLTLPAALVASSLPAAAQVFLTEEQALEAVFGSGTSVHRQPKVLSEPERKALQEASGLHFPESPYTFFVGVKEKKTVGYALVLNEIGKSEPITFMVAMSPTGQVTDVLVLVFRESRGWEVREKRFTRQFRGKTVSDPIRINQDIINYTGATLSSKALARGVKRALLLLEHFYPKETREEPPRSGLRVEPALPAPVLSVRGEGLFWQVRYLMGTLCEVRLWSESPRTAARGFAVAFAELHRLDRVFSNYRADSELSHVNRQAADGAVGVTDEFWRLTREAVRHWRHSSGAFDVTVGPLMKAWGFYRGRPGVPGATRLAEARARVGCDKLVLDARRRTVRFHQPGMEIDFGGLAKGYAAERAGRVLKRLGLSRALVNLGGSSLYALGDPPREGSASTGWVLAVADPAEPARTALLLELRGGWAVSTSGTYEKCFRAGEELLSHVLDPRSGQPLGGLRSATVVARSGRRAEALSKTLLLLHAAERRAVRPRLRRADWVLLESAQGERATAEHNLRHSCLLAPFEAASA